LFLKIHSGTLTSNRILNRLGFHADRDPSEVVPGPEEPVPEEEARDRAAVPAPDVDDARGDDDD